MAMEFVRLYTSTKSSAGNNGLAAIAIASLSVVTPIPLMKRY